MTTGIVQVSQYTTNPPTQLSAGDLLEVRGWYTRSFIAGDGVTPVEGNSTSGEQGPYYLTTPSLSVAGMVVPAHSIQATTLSNPTANYFEGLWVNGAFSQILMPNTNGATGWQIPTVYGAIISYDEIATYNRARRLVYPPDTYFTADQTIQEIERLAGNFDYMAVGVNGIGSASVPPVLASLPIVVMDNDPRVMGSVINVKAYPYYATGDGVTDDFAAIQAAQTALKALGAGILYFPKGTYLVSQAIQITECKGIIWQGAGCVNTIIKSSGSTAAVQGNGVWYSEFNDLYFTSTNVLSNKGVFELDGNYDTVHTQSVQGNIFRRCIFDGAGSTYAFTLVRQGGGGGQGSENLWLNCHWLRATDSCYYHAGFNAIGNTIIGGDFQSYQKNGIKYSGGSMACFMTSFESTYGYTQIINGGYDINTGGSGVYEYSQFQGNRTESLRFFNGATSQGADVIGLDYRPSGVFGGDAGWTALTDVFLNDYYFAVSPANNFKFYVCTTAGVSGVAEPTWPNSGTVADGSAVWTQTNLNIVNLPIGKLHSSTGFMGKFVISQGIPGSFLTVATINSVGILTSNTTLTLADDTAVCDTSGGSFTVTLPDLGTLATATTGKRFYIKKGTTDANTVTVSHPFGTNGIDGSNPVIIPGGSEGFLIVESDSVNVQYRIIGKSFALVTAGSALTISSNTIAPTNLTHQCGAGLIKTIIVPSGFLSGNSITIIPTAAYTYDATGNVATSGTATVGRAMTFTLVNTIWYASY